MAQPKLKPKARLSEALKVVDKLSAKEQEKLVHELKYRELRRDIQIGIEQSEKGQTFSEEEALAQLKAHAQALRKAGKK